MLRNEGHEVYDFRNLEYAFKWSDIDEDWLNWTPEVFRKKLSHQLAFKGYNQDFGGMKWADTCVLLLPSGRSAHIEAGTMIGWNKRCIIYLKPEKFEPELMYKEVPTSDIVINDTELLTRLRI